MALNWNRAKTKTYTQTESDYISQRRDMDANRILSKDSRDKKEKQKSYWKSKGALNKTKQPRLNPGHLTIYTDGACEPNPGYGGWAFVVYRDGKEIHCENGGSRRTTNNVMEMTGIYRALQWLKECGEEAVIFSDSQYAVKGATIWRRGWKKNGWKRKGGDELANAELWKEIDAAMSQVKVRILWVKGHDGLMGNDRADELSVEGRLAISSTANAKRAIADQLHYAI